MTQPQTQQIAATLVAASSAQSLKDLRKRKIQNVRVITRSAFQDALADLAKSMGQGDSTETKRITRLLEEVEKLGQAKIGLEHEKGLLEAERSRLQAELSDVAQAMGKQLGDKLPLDEVRGLVKELGRLREEREKTKVAIDTLQKQAKSRIDEEIKRSKALCQERENLVKNLEHRSREASEIEDEIEKLRGERDRLQEELNEHRDLIDDLRTERDQQRHERDEYRDERDLMREQRDQYREERDLMREQRETMLEAQAALEGQIGSLRRHVEELEGELDALQSPPEPEVEVAAEPEPVAEPATPRADNALPQPPVRPRRAPARKRGQGPGAQNFGFGFGFGGSTGR